MSLQQKKEDVYGALTLYRELAYYITRREEYERALQFFNEALARAPQDKRTLMGRSWARAKVCQYAGALQDIAQALQIDPEDLVAIACKALNTYLCCEFEDALILNIRMSLKRKKPDNFVMGVMHCSEAIENCIGIRSGHPLRDHFKIIRRLGWKRARDLEKPIEPKAKMKKKKKKKKKSTKKVVQEPVVPLIKSKPPKKTAKSGDTSTAKGGGEQKVLNVQTLNEISAYGPTEQNLQIKDSLHTLKTESDYVPPCQPFPFRPMQRYTTNIENYMAEKYLDNMYLDKIHLRMLKSHLGVESPNKQGTKQIIQMSKDGYKSLSYKQELLRTRRPFYYIKYQEARLSGALKARIQAELEKMQRYAKAEADKMLHKIIKAIDEKQSRVALEVSEKLKLFCDLKPKKVLPAREEYLNDMYKLVSMAYYQMFRLNKNQYEWDQDKRILNWLGMPCSREPSTDSVINQFKGVFTDWQKQISVYEERLRNAKTPDEMAWLYHELARYHMELKQFELARVYSRKCMSEGRAASSYPWFINAMMLMCCINVRQHNRNDAKVVLIETLGYARQFNDEGLEEYILKCLEVVEKVDFGDFFGAKVLEKREKQIIQMMAGAGMKDEVAYLFRKMGAMPATRRMSVMPGIRLEDIGGPKQTATTRKMSIMPTAKEPDDIPTPLSQKAKSTTSKSDKSAESTGIGFMELIKYHVD